MCTYRIRLFGGFVVQEPSGAVAPPLSQRRAEALLAILVVYGKLGCRRDRLIALLWPESDEAHGRHRVRDALYAARLVIGREAVLGQGDALRLNPSRVTSDVQAFEAALAEGRLTDAVAAYRGPFLDGFHVSDSVELAHWIDNERARLLRQFRLAVKGLAKEAETAGRWDVAAEWWGRLSAADPFDSRAAVRRIKALVRAGDRANAVREGEAHCRLLKRELGLDPDARLLQELERIRGDAFAPGRGHP